MSRLALKLVYQGNLLSQPRNSQEHKEPVVCKSILTIKVDHNPNQVDKRQSDLWLLQVYHQVCKTSLACLHLVWHLLNQASLSILIFILINTHTLMFINNLQEMLVLNNLIHSSQELVVLVHKSFNYLIRLFTK